MSDIRTQFVTRTIASGSATAVADSTLGHFDAIDDISKAFLVSASSPPGTAGIGRTTGSLNNSLRGITALASITSLEKVTFDDGETAIARDNLCGAWLKEYVGPAGGPNEIVSRGYVTVTIPDGATTADSTTAISGITSLAKCVPYWFARGARNSAEFTNHFVTVEVVLTGGQHKVRVTRGGTADALTVLVDVREYTGAKWNIQKVPHSFAASGVPEVESISSAVIANSYVYSTFRCAGNTPAHAQFYVWQSSTTALSFQVKTRIAGTAAISYVISHEDLNVAHYGTINGTNDLAATDTFAAPHTLEVTAVPDLSAAMVIAYIGSDLSSLTAPAGLYLTNFADSNTVKFQRCEHQGGTEFLVSVVDFSELVSARIDSISDVVDGSSFTLTGVFGTSPAVRFMSLDGSYSQTQSITSSDGDSITATAAIGDGLYGFEYICEVTDAQGGLVTIPVTIDPPAGYRVTNLVAPLLPLVNRLRCFPGPGGDLAGGDQVVIFDPQGTGVTIDDAEILANGMPRWKPAMTGVWGKANRAGRGWGAAALIPLSETEATPDAPPTFDGPAIDGFGLFVGSTDSNRDYSGRWTGSGTWSTAGFPNGITIDETTGVLTVAPTVAGTFANCVISLTDSFDQSASSNTFTITVAELALGATAVASPAIGEGSGYATVFLVPPFNRTAYSILYPAWFDGEPAEGDVVRYPTANGFTVLSDGTVVSSARGSFVCYYDDGSGEVEFTVIVDANTYVYADGQTAEAQVPTSQPIAGVSISGEGGEALATPAAGTGTSGQIVPGQGASVSVEAPAVSASGEAAASGAGVEVEAEPVEGFVEELTSAHGAGVEAIATTAEGSATGDIDAAGAGVEVSVSAPTASAVGDALPGTIPYAALFVVYPSRIQYPRAA